MFKDNGSKQIGFRGELRQNLFGGHRHEVSSEVMKTAEYDLATAEKIKDILIDSNATRFLQTWEKPWKSSSDQPDENHPLGQWNTLTTRERPAVIYDDGAAFCSPVIVFNEAGDAFHFHDAMLLADAYGNGYGMRAQRFFDAMTKYVGDKGVEACISGANLPMSEERQKSEINLIDELIDFVEEQIQKRIPDTHFESLVSKQDENQKRRSRIVADKTQICGFAFVPRYLAKDDRNHV